MNFETINEVRLAIKLTAKGSDGRRIFSILFKKAAIEFCHNNNMTKAVFGELINIRETTLGKWENQFNDNLFEMSAVTSVSATAKKSNLTILASLNKKIDQLTIQINLIKKCEALGLTVTL